VAVPEQGANHVHISDVDDLLAAAPVIRDIDRVVELIKEQFLVKELGEVRDLLGVRLSYDREHSQLKRSQPALAKQIYNEAGVDRFDNTPLDIQRGEYERRWRNS